LTMNRMILAALVGAAPLAACASYPAPQQHMADSIAAVRGAEELGAATQPQAALNLKLAQEELAKAKALMDDDKNEQADYMALRAKSDADLALALAKEHAAEIRAQQGEAQAKAVENGAHVLPMPTPSPVLPPTPSTVTPTVR
jgi:uncharacterized protein YqfA (UPF0365 family)